jgi:hypothetical protein
MLASFVHLVRKIVGPVAKISKHASLGFVAADRAQQQINRIELIAYCANTR